MNYPSDETAETIETLKSRAQERAQDALRAGSDYVRENPVPVIVGALLIGAALGALLAPRPQRQKDTAEAARELWDTIQSDLSEKIPQLKKKYARSQAQIVDQLQDLGSKLKWW